MTKAVPYQQKHDKQMKNQQGPFGDVRPDAPSADPRANGSRPQEKVEDRENVSMVTPEDYPAADRAIAQPK